MSQEQVTEHVFRQLVGDMWCAYCGLPKEAHRFTTAEQLKEFHWGQRVPDADKPR